MAAEIRLAIFEQRDFSRGTAGIAGGADDAGIGRGKYRLTPGRGCGHQYHTTIHRPRASLSQQLAILAQAETHIDEADVLLQ